MFLKKGAIIVPLPETNSNFATWKDGKRPERQTSSFAINFRVRRTAVRFREGIEDTGTPGHRFTAQDPKKASN